ncbi:MAG TPA: ribonuclease G [Paenalcaligenes sp.]|nr:ribonuclease G [Paenalcaligenes sp.]
MAEDILINVTPFETRVAIVEQGEIQELLLERTCQKGIVGNIYFGRVARVLPGMQSAFIDIGLDRSAFIHVGDLRQNRQERLTGAPITPIEKLLFEGQSIIVQVVKDPIGTKGARVTTQISIAGRMLVYMPFDPHLGISQRIEDEETRNDLKERMQSIASNLPGGFIVRTQAENATDEELQADCTYLRKLWQRISDRLKTQPCPSNLYTDLNLAERVLRDMVGSEIDKIVVDSRTTFQQMSVWSKTYTPSVHDRLSHYSGRRALFDTVNAEEEIQRALSRRVELNSGGYLIIDQTEALTAIDVNTGGYVGGRNFRDTIFKTNLEATVAIARQLRLRNLGGIILVDFIDMDHEEHRQSVLNELKRATESDHSKITISEFSQLGLVEMTRKRTRESLAQVLSEECPTCNSRGSVRTARTICYEILREILREARQFDPKEFRIIAAQEVVDLFLDEESQYLAQTGDFIGKPISLEVDPYYNQEQYDLILF